MIPCVAVGCTTPENSLLDWRVWYIIFFPLFCAMWLAILYLEAKKDAIRRLVIEQPT